MKATMTMVFATLVGLAATAEQAWGQPPILQVTMPDRARAADHDGGIYVVGTICGDLYVLNETGSYTVTSLGAGAINDVRIENPHIAVAAGTTVMQLSVAGVAPVEQWRMDLGEEIRSLDLSGDGGHVAYLSEFWDPGTDEDMGQVGVIQGGGIVARYLLPSDTDAIYGLDATRDMEYIAITGEPCPPGPEGESTGVELFRFDGATLSRQWGTALMNYYETTQVRVSEAKDYVASATSSGTYMCLLALADGAELWRHETPGKEQFACDGDDNLNYVIGATQAWWTPYSWFILENAGTSYEVLAEGTMKGPINDLDSNPDASLLAFGSDLGEFLLLSRTGDTVATVSEGNVYGIIDAIEIGDRTLLLCGDGFITLIPEPATLALLSLGAAGLVLRRRRTT